MSKNLKNKIKKAILDGGMVVAPRSTGKTRALAEVVAENENAVVVVSLSSQFVTMKDWLINFGLSENEAKNRIFYSRRADDSFLKGLHKDVYVDEYHLNDYRGPFKAAVTSYPFTVKVIK